MAGTSNSPDHHNVTVLTHLADFVFAVLVRIFAHNGVVDVVVERRAKLGHTTTILGAFKERDPGVKATSWREKIGTLIS